MCQEHAKTGNRILRRENAVKIGSWVGAHSRLVALRVECSLNGGVIKKKNRKGNRAIFLIIFTI